MVIYTVWINTHESYSSRGYASKRFSSKNKAENYIKKLKETRFKNYGATLWVEEEKVY